MAGRRITRSYLAKIDTLGADAILSRIAGGEPLKAVAESIGVSRQVLSGFLNSEQNREGLRAAREQAAHVLAEDALAISDAAKAQDVQVAKLRVDTRRWLASRTAASSWKSRIASRWALMRSRLRRMRVWLEAALKMTSMTTPASADTTARPRAGHRPKGHRSASKMRVRMRLTTSIYSRRYEM